MATIFPPNPQVGDLFTGAQFGAVFRWDGIKWSPDPAGGSLPPGGPYLALAGGQMVGEIGFVQPQDVDGSAY
jgi:hypothetical protein